MTIRSLALRTIFKILSPAISSIYNKIKKKNISYMLSVRELVPNYSAHLIYKANPGGKSFWEFY